MREKGFVLCTDVAERLGVNKGTVYRWVRDGRLRTVNFSGVHYIEWSSVVAMLEQVGPILGINAGVPR